MESPSLLSWHNLRIKHLQKIRQAEPKRDRDGDLARYAQNPATLPEPSAYLLPVAESGFAKKCRNLTRQVLRTSHLHPLLGILIDIQESCESE